jgi:hypothetical protein
MQLLSKEFRNLGLICRWECSTDVDQKSKLTKKLDLAILREAEGSASKMVG